jgi:hypothetical protein
MGLSLSGLFVITIVRGFNIGVFRAACGAVFIARIYTDSGPGRNYYTFSVFS